MPKMRMRVSMDCKFCGHRLMDGISTDGQFNPVTRSKNGIPMFLGKVLPLKMNCPNCEALVINVAAKFGGGIFATYSMRSEPK